MAASCFHWRKSQRQYLAVRVDGAHVDAGSGEHMGNVAAARQHLQSSFTELLDTTFRKYLSIDFTCNSNLFFLCLSVWISISQKIYTSAAYLLVGKEVDDGVIDRAGLGKVHGQSGDQWRDVELWIHDYHHWQRRVGQPANKIRYDHGQDHTDGLIILLLAGTPTLELHAPVQLRVERKFDTH